MMNVTSWLAYLISSINVAIKHGQYTGTFQANKLNMSIINKLKELNIIERVDLDNNIKFQKGKFKLKLFPIDPIIAELKMISKPGCKIHMSYKEMTKIIVKHKNGIVSTNQGIKTMKECIKEKIGGEALFVYS